MKNISMTYAGRLYYQWNDVILILIEHSKKIGFRIKAKKRDEE